MDLLKFQLCFRGLNQDIPLPESVADIGLDGGWAESVLVVLYGGDGAEPGVGQVGHAGGTGWVGHLPAAESPPEGLPELCREGVVQDRIDGT